ncbi:Hsp70 family protein [Aeoliella mucimassa]|uniref:Hsp70 family protein n=1 Tax=Aeoliella mucimassa TaxID=2527972 RepID=UPI0011A2055C|nr:Hsp70 family protein [Aeoliella mucimassa]
MGAISKTEYSKTNKRKPACAVKSSINSPNSGFHSSSGVSQQGLFEGTLEIISTSGESFLGGEDFTNRLVSLILQKQGLQFEIAEMQQPLRVARLRQLCEDAKRKLTDEAEVQVKLPEENGAVPENAKTVKISREAFATAVKPLLDRIAGPIGKALRDGRTEAEEVDDVILVGGATRMLPLADFVRDYFGSEPQALFNPDEVVCLGAAVQAALIADNRAVDDMVMTDVCPFTLGVNIAKDMGGQIRAGYFEPIIHRNTTIPVSKEHVFSTISPNQSEVQVEVYQGENRKVEKNLKIGELRVTGVPPGPAGQEVFIRFTYDLNGLLEVEAYVGDSDHKFSTVLTQHAADLTEKEMKEAVANLQTLKYYPREDMANQKLLRFAERMVGEISPFQREQFEAAIDMFEQAMSSGDRETVEAARNTLEQILSMLGIDFEGQIGDHGDE